MNTKHLLPLVVLPFLYSSALGFWCASMVGRELASGGEACGRGVFVLFDSLRRSWDGLLE